MLFAGLLTIPVIGISVGRAVRAYLDTYRQLAAAIVRSWPSWALRTS